MKKNKRALISMIVFLTVFCLTAIFNIQNPLYVKEGDYSNADDVDVVLTNTEALAIETPEIEVQSFSYNISSDATSGEDQYLTSEETQLNLAETNNDQENRSLTTEAPSSEKVATSKSAEAKLPATNEVVEQKPKALYANIGISVAKSFVNIRETASTDSSVLGKLYRDCAVEILETKDDWYYVESGNVKGFVKSEFIKTGIPDEELIEKYSVLRMAVAVDGLNVREEPSMESKKLTVVYKNETYSVVEIKDDWIKIDITDDKVVGYVKNEFADLLVDFKKAISKEEEQEILQLEAEARAKKETEVKIRNGVSYSDADLKLLACLVHSEAGTQSYEGKLAVANIVLNRVKSSKYANTIKGVIYQAGQFSVAASGSLAKQLDHFDDYSSNSQLLSIKAAKAALEGANNIGTRLYFHSYKAAVKKGYDDKSNSVKLDDHLFW